MRNRKQHFYYGTALPPPRSLKLFIPSPLICKIHGQYCGHETAGTASMIMTAVCLFICWFSRFWRLSDKIGCRTSMLCFGALVTLPCRFYRAAT